MQRAVEQCDPLDAKIQQTIVAESPQVQVCLAARVVKYMKLRGSCVQIQRIYVHVYNTAIYTGDE